MQALLLFAAAASTVSDMAPWERAEKWLCRANTMRICTTNGACESKPGQAVVTVDFKNSLYKVFGTEDRYAERIVAKKYVKSQFGSSSANVSLDSGTGFAMDVKPTADTISREDGVDAVMTRIGVDRQLLYYSVCYPSD